MKSTLLFILLIHLFASISTEAIRETNLVFNEPTEVTNFCLLPADVPLSFSQFTAYLILTFSDTPFINEISFLQIDNYNTVFLGNFATVDAGNSNSIVLILHDGFEDYFGFNSQIFNDFQFVVGSVISDVPLISISLQLIADSYLPGLTNECPRMEGIPFQLIPFFAPNKESNQISNNEEISETEEQLINDNNDDNNNENDDEDDDNNVNNHHNDNNDKYHSSNGLVIALCFVFTMMILISCVASSYVIISTVKNDPKLLSKKEVIEMEGEDISEEDSEFLV